MDRALILQGLYLLQDDDSAMFWRKLCKGHVDVLTDLVTLTISRGIRKRRGMASSSSTSTRRPFWRSKPIAKFAVSLYSHV
jgi:hypothetical protein